MQTIKQLGSYTFPCLLENSFKRFPDRPCLSFPGEKPLTYQDVHAEITSVQQLLKSLRLHAGSKVAIYARNSPHWVISYLAVVTLGMIAVPLLPDFSAVEVETCLTHVEADCVFVGKNFLEKVPKSIHRVVLLEDFSIVKQDKVQETSIAEETPHITDNTIASIIYTSGTTGRSKGVVLTHGNLISNAVSGQYGYRVSKYDRFLSILPIAHVYEFTVGFLMPFMNGAHIVYLFGPPIPRILMPTLKIVRPNIILAVPLIIEKIYKKQVLPAMNKDERTKKLLKFRLFRKFFCKAAGKKIKKAFGGRIQFFGLGGAKLDTEIEQFLKTAGFPYAIGYGLTETSPLIAYSSPRKTKPGYTGFVAQGVQAKIINQNKDGIGELVVKGPNVMAGYYKAENLTKEAFTEDGFFKTGDLFRCDKHGRLAIKGRIKNMILNSAGENIYPEDIEFILNHHDCVSESLVVESENSSLTALIKLTEEKIKALQAEEAERQKNQTVKQKIDTAVETVGETFNAGRDRLLNEIMFFVNSRVNSRSKINKIEIVENFEKTASGKIKRYLYNFLKK